MNTSRSLLLFATLFLITNASVQNAISSSKSLRARRFRGKGGWTLNSVGYNGGVGALRKIFGKRSGEPTYDTVEANNPIMSKEEGPDDDIEYLDDLVDEFLTYLEWKESGRLREEIMETLGNKDGEPSFYQGEEY